MTNSTNHQCDVLVIGSGAAGLSLALRLADRYQVTVISKGPVAEGATRYAQGGIAAVFEQRDTIQSHISDTLIAGAGLCDSDAVAFVTRNARHAVEWLIDQGVCFDSTDKHHYHLTREGGHSHRRILHCADATGLTVETTLVSRAMQHPHLQLLPDTCAIDLQRTTEPAINGTHPVTGADLWHRPSGRTIHCRAQIVILATGGASGVYPYTTNPDSASGDGIAIAWRAGCRIANMEFNQFHPTCLYHAGASHFLLTEALRGEGAFLVRADGTRFMPAIDARAELAPRDIVARAINQEISQSGSDCVYLDISHRPVAFIRQHFPMITDKLRQLGLDLTRDPIPVVPAAHYTCGGVMTSQYGRTDIPGLYAIGEVSYTGLHGANRLASNSLLECLVYGWSAADDIRRYLSSSATHHAANQLSLPGTKDPVAPRQEAMIQQRLHQLRQLMWWQAGITRTLAGLQQAETNIIRLQQETADDYRQGRYSASLLALRNLTEVALLIVRSAQQRKESRGLHSLTDYPHQHAATGPTILTPAKY